MTPSLRFLLCALLVAGPAAAQEEKKNIAATPAPKLDKDQKPQAGFMKSHEEFVAVAQKGGVDVLFLGDSITAGWRGAGKEAWARDFAPLKAANFGIGGDRTQHVLWRITNGELEGITPKVAVIMIGTNNTGSDSAEDIAGGIAAIVKTVLDKSPATKILLLAVFPRGKDMPNPGNTKIQEINRIIAKLDDGKKVKFFDIGPKFMAEDKTLPKDVMPDFLHLSPKGYGIWAEAMLPTLKELLGS